MTARKTTAAKTTKTAAKSTVAATPATSSQFKDWEFHVVQGVQSGRIYWVSKIEAKQINKMFTFDRHKGTDTSPLGLIQRTMNLTRVKKLSQYISGGIPNHKDPVNSKNFYILSGAVVAIDGDVEFDEMPGTDFGILRVKYGANFHPADGQHRLAGLRDACGTNPDLYNESIPCMFILDTGVSKLKQIFKDININAKPPNKSIYTLFDDQNLSLVTQQVMLQVSPFKFNTAYEQTNVSSKSNALVSLNALRDANKHLLKGYKGDDPTATAIRFWQTCAKSIPEWYQAQQPHTNLSNLREDTIAFHSITLNALGMVGATLMQQYPEGWNLLLAKLGDIDWSRYSPEWEGVFTFNNGKILKTAGTTTALANYIRQQLEG